MTKRVLKLPGDRPSRLVVLISGDGSNLQALSEATANPAYGAEIVGVVSDRETAGGLQWAQSQGIPTAAVCLGD